MALAKVSFKIAMDLALSTEQYNKVQAEKQRQDYLDKKLSEHTLYETK